MHVNKLLALVAFSLIAADPALAQESFSGANVWSPLGAGLGLGIAAFGGALAQGKIISAALDAIARNPGAAGKMLVPWFLGVVLVESLVVYSLIVSLKLVGLI